MGSTPIISTIFRPEAFYVSGLKIEKHGAREAFRLPFCKPQARQQKFWDGYCFFVRNGV